jgi:hypothetical protein
MTRLQLRALVAAVLAAAVVIGAVICAAYRLSIVASALAIFALGVGAWLYHSVERLLVARRIDTVRSAAKPLQPLLPLMAALMGLTQTVVRSLGDVSEAPMRLPMLRWMDGARANRGVLDGDGRDNRPDR